MGRDPFNQNSDRSDREKRTTSKGGPVFSKLFRLDRADPLSFGPKFGKEHFFYKTCNWEVSHRAWSSKTRVKKCTTKRAAGASRLILWSSLLFVEYVNKEGPNFISLLILDMVPWKSASRRFAYICQSKWVGIIVIKTERREFNF